MRNVNLINKIIYCRLEKEGDVSVALSAPPAPFRAAHFSASALFRRAVRSATARLSYSFSKNHWKLASRTSKMSPNFVVQAAPNGKFKLFCGGGPRKTQFHGGFLADDVEVRRAERGIKPNGKMNRIPFGFIANFLLFAEGKTSKFPVKESDNFPCEARLCPKAITNKAL